jgi:acyl-coenzyme A thioesterase 13
MGTVPQGFGPLARVSPFIELIGPVFERRGEDGVSIGLSVATKHANRRGMCHGGVLASLADIALGYSVAASTGGKVTMVTASLTIDYAGSAKVGDWIESEVEVQHAGSRLAFANCYLVAAGKRVVRASAIFAVAAKAR